ncbi:MAG: amino acid--tRNA ligase-related protein [Microgenomates group bacterium]
MDINQLLKTTRQYFWDKEFTEVEVNYLNRSLPLEPNLYSFKVNDWYLPTSPEFALKELLAKSPQNCFAIGHCFRNLESTSLWHTPEFLMLEWYEVGKNLEDLKQSTQEYIHLFLPNIKFSEFKIPPNNFDNEPDFNQFFLNVVEPSLPHDGAVFVTGYPAFLSPLAQRKPHGVNGFSEAFNTPVLTGEEKLFTSVRFELYINGIEIANACEENRDAESIKSAFLQEEKYRLENHLPTHPISDKFVENCSNIPLCSGIGLGIDRLLKIINGVY